MVASIQAKVEKYETSALSLWPLPPRPLAHSAGCSASPSPSRRRPHPMGGDGEDRGARFMRPTGPSDAFDELFQLGEACGEGTLRLSLAGLSVILGSPRPAGGLRARAADVLATDAMTSTFER